jgi:CheY-like chemotaxis protein
MSECVAVIASLGTVKRARRILIVDDNRDAADSLALLLRLQGYETKAV